MNPVDPPDLGLLPTFGRLLRLWRAEWRLGTVGLSLAFVYTMISIAIPLLMQQAVDHAIVKHTKPLWPYIAAIVGLAIVRFLVNFSRRYATARIGIRIEARMRELLFSAYLRYPRAFYDRHATGQVLSRATNDLYPIRYFIGWGLVQGMQSLMMIVSAGIVLVLVNPRLALYTAVAMPPITVLALRFARRVSPLSRKVQVRKGDVTEAADEAVVGIEMVQAFGREEDVRGRFGGKAEAVRDTVLEQAGVEARHLPGLYYLPALSIAAVVFFGGRQVIAGHLSIGQFVLFETLLLQLVWPLEALGWITNLGQRALASAGSSHSRSRRTPSACPRGLSACASPPCTSPTEVRKTCCAGSTSRSSPVRSLRCAARPGRARRRFSTCCRVSTTRRVEACSSATSTRARFVSPSCVPTSRS